MQILLKTRSRITRLRQPRAAKASAVAQVGYDGGEAVRDDTLLLLWEASLFLFDKFKRYIIASMWENQAS